MKNYCVNSKKSGATIWRKWRSDRKKQAVATFQKGIESGRKMEKPCNAIPFGSKSIPVRVEQGKKHGQELTTCSFLAGFHFDISEIGQPVRYDRNSGE